VGSGVHRILVAEDDTGFRAALEELLAADGRFKVIGHADNGREAIELAERLKPDAVIMDIEMPEVDGVEATRALRTSTTSCARRLPRCSRARS
jgi:DNA-binding NarL/FixJ family response regulator